MRLQEIASENCGAAVRWDGTYGVPVMCEYCGTTFMPAASMLDDVWLMTDPVARARYDFEGRLDQLEHDIRFEVMRGQNWSTLDREYWAEIQRLENEGSVRKLASFWAVSPHPPIYRALKDGEIRLGGINSTFKVNDEIVWACPMTCDRFELKLPVIIGDLQESKMQHLCGEMLNAMQGRMG